MKTVALPDWQWHAADALPLAPIGPEFDYSGPVTPYLASIALLQRQQYFTCLN